MKNNICNDCGSNNRPHAEFCEKCSSDLRNNAPGLSNNKSSLFGNLFSLI